MCSKECVRTQTLYEFQFVKSFLYEFKFNIIKIISVSVQFLKYLICFSNFSLSISFTESNLFQFEFQLKLLEYH